MSLVEQKTSKIGLGSLAFSCRYMVVVGGGVVGGGTKRLWPNSITDWMEALQEFDTLMKMEDLQS